mgnify:CR=1 FL=1
MKKTLNFYVITLLIIISIFSAGVVSLIANIGTGIKFRKYIYEKHQNRNKIIYKILEESYNKNKKFDEKSLKTVDMYAMMDNLKLSIYDEGGQKIWENNYIGHSIEMTEATKRESYIILSNNIAAEKIIIIINKKIVGKVILEFDGKYMLSYQDINFLNEFNKWILFSMFISILFSVLLGRYLSKRLVNPISNVIQAAKNIKNGEFSIKITETSGIKEVDGLADSINNMAESLRKNKELRKELVSDMSHEIRTPLTTIKTHLEALIDKIWEPTEERLKGIYEEIERLIKMIKELEKIDELENSNIILEKIKFNLYDTIESVIQNFQAEADKNEIKILLSSEREIYIEGDIDKFKQILINLISNSIKYSNQKGLIKVEIIKGNKRLYIKIIDNGIGIDEKHISHIFERFYKVDKSRVRGGMGIGLAVVKSIIEAHNWKIEIKSKKHIGTEVIIIIPEK